MASIMANELQQLRIYNHVVVTACSLGRKPKELDGTSAAAAKRRSRLLRSSLLSPLRG
jgi:hypothetical protein